MNRRGGNTEGSDSALATANPPNITDDLEALVDGGFRFRTILADPPWRYSNTSSRAAAENHYRTMTVEQICNEPIRQLIADRAHLHLWATNAFLESAFTVMRAWGFEYKSCLVWAKPQIGLGNYWRVSHEFLEQPNTEWTVYGNQVERRLF